MGRGQPLSERLGSHPRHVGLAALIVGLLLAQGLEIAIGAAALLAIAVVTLTGRARLAVACAGLIIAGHGLGGMRLRSIDHSGLSPLIGRYVEARGFVAKRERSSHGEQRLRMRLRTIGMPGHAPLHADELVQLRSRALAPDRSMAIGSELRANGKLMPLPPRLPGSDFDYPAYLRRNGVHAVLRADQVRATGARRGGLNGFVDSVRRRAEAGVTAGLPAPLDSLALGMVLGEDEDIPKPLSDDFKASGLAHVLAVSGQNVTLLAILAWFLLAAVRLTRRMRLLAVLALIALYVPLTGAGASIVRAGAMGAAATAAALAGRPGSRWYALLLAAAFTLIVDPRASQDVGWQLSFAAVIGIFVLMRSLMSALARVRPSELREGLAMTVAATASTAPLMAFHFGRFSLVSLAANVIALPAIAPIMWAGMVSAALAQVWLPPTLAVNAFASVCLGFVAWVAHATSRLPLATIPVQISSIWTLIIVYASLGVSIVGLHRRRRSSLRVGPRLPIVAAVIVAALATGAGISSLSDDQRPRPRGFAITFLDVGQGDAVLIRTLHGAAVLVDAGPPEANVASQLDDIGVDHVQLAVVTHPQRDHEGGMASVIDRLRVDTLVDGGHGDSTADHRAVLAAARRRKVQAIPAKAGDRFQLDGLRLRVLAPEQPYRPGLGDPNEQAIVLLASYRSFDALLTADAESDVTSMLRLPPVELIKVAHHGSADPGLSRLLARLRPQIAVIEVGVGNLYGHPARQALQALRVVPQLYRTDRNGRVEVRLGPTGFTVTHH